MKTMVIIFLLFLVIRLNCQPAFFISAESFVGSFYYPDQISKEFSFFDKQDIRFGLESINMETLQLDLILKYSERLHDYSLSLKKLQLLSDFYCNWSAAFLIDDVGYGMASEYFEMDITNPDYRQHRLGDYRFTGLDLQYYISPRLKTSLLLGGNQYNTAVGSSSLSWISSYIFMKIFYLHVGRDNNFNKTMHSVGAELDLQPGVLEVKHTQTWQHLSSLHKTHNFLTYNELIFHLTDMISTGGNLFYARKYRGFSSWWEYSILITYNPGRFVNNLIFSRQETAKLKSERLTGIFSYTITDNFSCGLNSAIHFPQLGKNYYSFGLQVKINEKYLF